MRKAFKRIMGIALTMAMVAGSVPATPLIDLDSIVKAAENPFLFDDTKLVDSTVIGDNELRTALYKIVGGGEFNTITMKELREYDGELDLNSYTKIRSLDGLGYAVNASSIKLDKLTGVTKIAKNEFTDCNFKTITLPANLTEIGASAFLRCENVSTIDFPSTVGYIGGQAFSGCKKLNNITLPDGLYYLGTEAFSQCTSLTKIAIPDNINAAVESLGEDFDAGIGENVFMDCSSLVEVEIGDAMTAIPAGTFSGTTSLQSISIPSKIISIRDGAFSASGLVTVDLSNNVNITKINDKTFSNCINLVRVGFPKDLIEIGNNAFENCASLEDLGSFTTLSSLTTIGNYAFAQSGLTSLIVPENVESIGSYAFYGCLSLAEAKITDFTKEPVGNSNLIKKIGSYAFASSTFLERVVLPTANQNDQRYSIEIGAYAFDSCAHLSEINFPMNITKIGDYAFNKCGKSVTDFQDLNDEFPEGYTGGRYYCEPSAISFELDTDHPDKIMMYSTEMGEEFYQPIAVYANLKAISKVRSSDTEVTIVVDDGTKDVNMHTQKYAGLVSVDLSNCNRIEEMGKGVFKACVNLKVAYLPDTLTEIPAEMFKECYCDKYAGNGSPIKNLGETATINDVRYYGLEEVYMSDNVTKIGDNAFEKCYRLKLSDDLPSKLENIGASAFRYCQSIKSITLPRTLKRIGSYAFADNSRIDGGKVMSANYGLRTVEAKAAVSLNTIDTYAFKNSSVSEFILNTEAPVQKVSVEAFSNCQYLTTIQFSNHTKFVDSKALATCIRLKKVNISDECLFDTDVCLGGTIMTGLPSNEIFYSYVSGNSVYYTTNTFAVYITPNNNRLSVRENGTAIIPLCTIEDNVNNASTYNEVGVNSYKYEYSSDIGGYLGDEVNTPLYPSIVSTKVTTEKNEFTSATTNTAKAIQIYGMKKVQNVTVYIQENLSIRVNSAGTAISCTPSVSYTVDVTDNPCKDIVTEEAYYVKKSTSTKQNSVTISPDFIPTYSDSDITEIPEWTIEAGEEYITLTVAEDGKSAVVMSSTEYASSIVKITTANCEKRFYIYTSDAADSIKIQNNGSTIRDGSKVDLMMESTSDLTMTLTYLNNDNPVYEGVSVKSSDPTIVSVTDLESDNNTVACKLNGLKTGTASITVCCLASGNKITFTVNVTTNDLSVILTTSDGTEVKAGDVYDTLNNAGISFDCSLSNDTISTKTVLAEIDKEDNISFTYNSARSNVTFKGKKCGKVKVTVYPTIGTAENNGLTFFINVKADVNSIGGIVLASGKTIAIGAKDTVFSSMTNTFYESIKTASQESFKSITDNTIVFESDYPQYVKVDNYGNVEVLKKLPNDVQYATITCSAYRGEELIASKSTTVKVKTPAITDAKFGGNYSSIVVGTTVTVPITAVPSNATITSIYATMPYADSSVVSCAVDSVNKKLVIKGKKVGKATITLSITDENREKITKTLVVKVVDKPFATSTKVSIKKPVAGKKQVKISWAKAKSASGYIVQMSTKKTKGFKTIKKVTKVNTTSFVKKKLKSNKKYYFRVRAYGKTSTGKIGYGKWSKVVTAKVK